MLFSYMASPFQLPLGQIMGDIEHGHLEWYPLIKEHSWCYSQLSGTSLLTHSTWIISCVLSVVTADPGFVGCQANKVLDSSIK